MVRKGKGPVSLDDRRERNSAFENEMKELKELLHAKEGKIAQLEQIFKSEEVPPWTHELIDSFKELHEMVKHLHAKVDKIEEQQHGHVKNLEDQIGKLMQDKKEWGDIQKGPRKSYKNHSTESTETQLS